MYTCQVSRQAQVYLLSCMYYTNHVILVHVVDLVGTSECSHHRRAHEQCETYHHVAHPREHAPLQKASHNSCRNIKTPIYIYKPTVILYMCSSSCWANHHAAPEWPNMCLPPCHSRGLLSNPQNDIQYLIASVTKLHFLTF